MHVTVPFFSPEHIRDAVEKINSPESPFDFRVRLASPPQRFPNNYGSSYSFLIDIPPTKRTILYYAQKPTYSGTDYQRDAIAIELPLPWITLGFNLTASDNARECTMYSAYCYHTTSRIDSVVNQNLMMPWMGNHEATTVCHGNWFKSNMNWTFDEMVIDMINYYYSSTFNHSMHPYTTSSLMHHFAIMAGCERVFESISKRVSCDSGFKVCQCHAGYAICGDLVAKEIHATYKYMSGFDNIAQLARPFFMGILTHVHGTPRYDRTHVGVPSLFRSLYDIDTIDEYRDHVFDVHASYYPYELKEIKPAYNGAYNERSISLRTLHRVFSEEETVAALTETMKGKRDLPQPIETDPTKLEQLENFYFYMTGKKLP